MSNLLLPFDDMVNPSCWLTELLDPGDVVCYDTLGNSKYQVIDERSSMTAQALSDCEGLSLATVSAKPLAASHVLPSFIPVVTDGSRKLMEHFTPLYVGVMIGDVVSSNLRVVGDIRKKMGIPAETKIVLLGYGEDKLIEAIWPRHYEIFNRLADAGIDLFVPINYSIWLVQPHLERLINVKRNLIIFQTLQRLGLEAVPHLYWSGHADLSRIAVWINENPDVTTVAINLQTLGRNELGLWNRNITELTAFARQVRPLHYIISGPQTLSRMRQIIQALGPDVTFTNASAAVDAWNNKAVSAGESSMVRESLYGIDKEVLFVKNVRSYSEAINRLRDERAKEMLAAMGRRFDDHRRDKFIEWIHDQQRAVDLKVGVINQIPVSQKPL